MKKFYNEPEMNISMFEVENVVTASGETNTAMDNALGDLSTALGGTVTAKDAIIITF